MSTVASRPYTHYGVVIPWASTAPDQWVLRNKIVQKGFLLVEAIKQGIYVVQSLETGELYVQKTVGPGGYSHNPPEEIRISTYPQALRQLPTPSSRRGIETIHFSQLVAWQMSTDDNDHEWYTLYHR